MEPLLREKGYLASRRIGVCLYLVLLLYLLGLALSLTPKGVIISLDGDESYHLTHRETIGEFLQELNLDQGYLVAPARQTTIKTGQKIMAKSYHYQKQVIQEFIPFSEEVRLDKSLLKGVNKTIQEGVSGLKEKTYQKLIISGQEKASYLQETKLVRAPLNRVIAKGTGDPVRPKVTNRSKPSLGETIVGIASWYGGKGDGFHGRPTASGEIFDSSQLTAAHPTLPFGTMIEVVNLANNKKITVRINDRGPFVQGRIVDLSQAAAKAIGIYTQGLAPVRIRVLRL